MSAKVKIVTDSSSYPEPEVIAKYDIRVVPLRVAFGSEVFAEGVDITNEEFYQRLAKGGKLPTTSQPSVADLIRVYRELAEQGHPILSLHISSKLSGTCASALAAKNALPQAQIEIIDALTIAMGMLIYPAAEAAERGETLSQIVASIEKLNKCIKVVGAFDTLEYLRKGGRIGAARALVGTLLKIKPVLTQEGGEVKVLNKSRTMAHAIEYILGFVEKEVKGSISLHGWVAHSHVPDAARVLEKGLRERFNWIELRFLEMGPVLGTHMGPGLVGASFYCDEDWHSE
ncbi:MAG: DegV family protein [Dehalococcoidia bacterium]|nr:DegV family protein [Dehalococcoidia bacterium]